MLKLPLVLPLAKKLKAPFARMNGKWRNVDPEVAREQAEKFINDPNWTQVGMNPYRHSFFYDKATGQPVELGKRSNPDWPASSSYRRED
jgi:hypothetical protein